MSQAMQQDIRRLQRDMSDVKHRLGGVERRLDKVEGRLGKVETTLHNVVVVVSAHSERFDRLDEKLKKLDVLDQIKSTMDALAGDLKSSRDERALSNKTFREQQATLTDHELRIFRLERNAKPS